MGVYVVKSLDGETIETVANETARAWKIGYSEIITVSLLWSLLRIENHS